MGGVVGTGYADDDDVRGGHRPQRPTVEYTKTPLESDGLLGRTVTVVLGGHHRPAGEKGRVAAVYLTRGSVWLLVERADGRLVEWPADNTVRLEPLKKTS